MINLSWSHLSIQVVQFRQLQQMFICHVLDFMENIVRVCNDAVKNICQLVYFEIWDMDYSYYVYLEWFG